MSKSIVAVGKSLIETMLGLLVAGFDLVIVPAQEATHPALADHNEQINNQLAD
jgi:hypothetical protein